MLALDELGVCNERRGLRWGARTFDPVEPIGAQQDEVNQQRQSEQEYEQRHESAARIE
jgi:hypothetical protein